MHFTVTGASGLLGNNLVRFLLELGHDVRVVSRQQSDRSTLVGLDVEVISGDLRDEAIVKRLVLNTGGVFHCAAFIWIGHQQLQASRSANVDVSRSVAAACRAHSTRMIHVSSVDALAASKRDRQCNEQDVSPPKPGGAYVISKREAEQAVLQEFSRGTDVTIVNPSFMVGPFDWKPSSGKMMLAIAKRFVPFAPGGGFSVVDVRDVARGMLSAMERGTAGERYILAGENMRYLELWNRIARVIGRRPPICGMGPVFAKVVGLGADALGAILRRELEVNSASVSQGQTFQYYDSSKAVAELGYHMSDVDVALRDAWNWFQENGYATA